GRAAEETRRLDPTTRLGEDLRFSVCGDVPAQRRARGCFGARPRPVALSLRRRLDRSAAAPLSPARGRAPDPGPARLLLERGLSMNTFTLYNRYKKHLLAADRSLVDALANAVATGATAEIPSRVEHILQKTWQAED